MRTRTKLLFAGCVIGLTLSVAVTAASAGRFSVSTRTLTSTWNAMDLSTTGGFGPASCQITMSGSFHSNTIRKVNGALIGHINRATVSFCTGGGATINQEALPWHVRYRAFRGTLPNITGLEIGLVGFKITVDYGAGPCTTQSTATNPWVAIFNTASGRVGSTTFDEGATIPLRGSFFCAFPGNLIVRGTSNSTTAVTLTLI